MGTLGVILGGLLLAGSAGHFAFMLMRPDSPARWRALERHVRSLDGVGGDYGYLTRAYYVAHVAIGVLGVAFLIIGITELGWISHTAANWVGLALLFTAILIFGVGAVVARTGRPRRWIPPPYRDDER